MLPPVRLLSHSEVPQIQDPLTPVVVDGKQLTRGDLWGYFRLDPPIGYTYQESVTSKNGWWESNNVGARSRTDASQYPPRGRTRVLVFGESFAQGSRISQENAWPNVIGNQHPELEVLNLAVDGYSMGQSFLRYGKLRKKLNYDVALLMFAPEADLWRDINTLRQLFDSTWDMPLLPRFILNDGRLELAPALYTDVFDLWRRNGGAPTPELRQYLRTYDRLYFPAKYEAPELAGASIMYRLFARAVWMRQETHLRAGLMDPEEEALQVSRAIFQAMQHQAQADGAVFGLIILPIEHHWWHGRVQPGEIETWKRMASFVCDGQALCIDLLPDLLRAPAADVDRAYDDWHFGPKMNLRIAATVADRLPGRKPHLD